MATFNYLSTINYDQNGNSANYADDGGEVDVPGTLNDTDGGATFDSGDTFNEVGGTFLGTFTDVSGNVYVIVETSPEPNSTWTIYSPLNQADTATNLPNTINVDTDVNTGNFTPCFLSGTLIATPKGEVAVEDLRVGDMVLTKDHAECEVKWIGHKKISTLFGPAEHLMPIQFSAGSLAENVPHTDLTVTADHAMLVDGVLCHAGALVNGTSITRVPLTEMGETFTVYHIETDAHEIILSNGAPSETYIDNVSRRVFDNFAEYEAMYGDEEEMVELPLPRATSARQVPASIKARLAGKAVA